jgi:hypothetical protein
VKSLILLLGFLICFNAMAQAPSEPSWKARLRSVITRVAGEEWSGKILGPLPVEEKSELEMPQIPREVKKSTDLTSYSKKTKDPTEFDKLPAERKRQFNYKFLEELFLVTRKTQARDEDLANWLNTLEQGGSREGIYQALVLDEVYNGLESMEEKPTKRLLDFSLKFSQKFLRQTFRPESLSQLNLYSLKRIFTEKGLDLMEYYEVRDLDALYRWYALFSANAGKEFGVLMHSPIRKNDSPRYHYEWAKSMPVQHIKSEFIVKLHTVMNGLQLLPQE